MRHMKEFLIVAAIAAFSVSNTSIARERFTCFDVSGEITIELDKYCSILTSRVRASQFPDVTFLAEFGVPDSCFLGNFEGSLVSEDKWLTLDAVSYSGVISVDFAHASIDATSGDFLLPFTAATILESLDGKHQLYLRDSGVQINPLTDPLSGNARELLQIIGGKGNFKGAKGTITIDGPEFEIPGATVGGTICTRR